MRHTTHKRFSKQVRLSVIAIACALSLALAGCMAGSEWVSSFSREFSDDPAVASLDLTTADNMPFTGGVGGTVLLRDGLDDAQTRAISEDVRKFGEQVESPPDDPRFRITLDSDGWTFPVLADASSNSALLDLVLAFRADPRFASGEIRSADYRSTVSHVSVTTTHTADAFTAFSEATTAFSTLGPSAGFTITGPSDPEGSLKLSGNPGPWVQPAQQVYDALRSTVSLASFRAEESSITVTVSDESDAASAEEIAMVALDGAPLDIFVQSDLITLFPGARGTSARSVLAGLDANARDLIVGVWTDDASVSLHVDSVASAGTVAEALSHAPETSAFTAIELIEGSAAEPTLRVYSAPETLMNRTHKALALLEHEGVTAVRVKQGFSLDLVLQSAPSTSEIADYAVALKSLSDFDERLCLNWPYDGFCTVTAAVIDPTERNASSSRGRAFVDAWNDTP